MRCAVIFSKLTNRGAVPVPLYQVTGAPDRLVSSGSLYFADGTYTLDAVLTPETGKTVTCRLEVYDVETESRTYFPETGEALLPYSFSLEHLSWVTITFGYSGWSEATYGHGDPIDLNAVSDAGISEYGKPANDMYEFRAMHPDEISDECTLTQAIHSKATVELKIYPEFEVWGYAERSLTYVRIFDLDRSENRMIFKGRVTIVTDKVDNSGRNRQEITCVSAMDFLEDTDFTETINCQLLDDWLGYFFKKHNDKVDTHRKITLYKPSEIYPITEHTRVYTYGERLCMSSYSAFTRIITGGKYLLEGSEGVIQQSDYTLEWRETYRGDDTCIEIKERHGKVAETVIVVGDNLGDISVEKTLDGGIYSSILAIGHNSNSSTIYYAVAYNTEMLKKYGDGRRYVMTCEGTFTSSAQVMTIAKREAAKLSDPPVKISLNAHDLAMMGYTDYKEFEVFNDYAVVCPQVGLYGQTMRITGLKRRLSDGRVEQLVMEKGQKLKPRITEL